MTDVVCIDKLALRAKVGVYPHERRVRQKIVLSIRITTSLEDAGKSDDVNLTIDYDQVAQTARDLVAKKHYNLIESVAETLADALLNDLGEKASRVWIRVEKPGAVHDAQTVAVEITRRPPP